MTSKTKIHYIGGNDQGSIADLLKMLSLEPLETINVEILRDGSIHVLGNFLRISYVFNLDTFDRKLLKKLGAAFEDNGSIDDDPERNPISEDAKSLLFASRKRRAA